MVDWADRKGILKNSYRVYIEETTSEIRKQIKLSKATRARTGLIDEDDLAVIKADRNRLHKLRARLARVEAGIDEVCACGVVIETHRLRRLPLADECQKCDLKRQNLMKKNPRKRSFYGTL